MVSSPDVATSSRGGPAPAAPSDIPRGAALQLLLATVGFGVNFWAWALMGPLGPAYKTMLDLTAFQQSLVVAVPVIVGSIGRIPIGGLTDKLGARVMFPAVSFLTILPVLYVGHLATSFATLLIGGFFLGLGGTAFAVGVPFVNAWFPPARRGFALGIFGVGTGGTAISAFTTVKLATSNSASFPFDVVAVALAVYGVIALLMLRDAPGRTPGTGSFWGRIATAMRLKVTIQLAMLYAVGFGGFVAFSVYLPTYLKNAYHLTADDAASRTAGFVVLAVMARPVGGWLSDRFHPVPVLTACFTVVFAPAAVAALHLELVPLATMAFLGMAAALGAAAGGVFALVARVAPADKVGSVTGVVGAAGGLGGFIPPLIMGYFYGLNGSYTIGFVLLALLAGAAAAYTWTAMRRADA
jgi:NNP family nitrate/nitrite transporter-like MFS transporter